MGAHLRRADQGPRAYVEMHPEDAARLGVLDAKPCFVKSRRGSIRVQARVGTTVPKGMVYIPAGAKTPELKYLAVRVEKAGK